MLNILAGLGFLGFVLAALGAAAVPPGRDRRRARVQAFLLYSVAISFGAGLTQRDAWPFSAWPLVAGVLSASVTHPRLVAVDEDGIEHPVDFRAWQPLGFDELMSWIGTEFPRLPPAGRERVAAHLLHQAERARVRARAGGGVGRFDRYLGPLSAPYFLLHPRIWSRADVVPAKPFVRLRVYKERWDLLERQRHDTAPVRLLVFEHPKP